MKTRTIALATLGLGAGLMYLADPQDGRRRRARLRDSAVHAGHRVQTTTRMTAHDVANRVTGLKARAISVVDGPDAADDEVVAERVRARLGRLVAHPHAIRVKVTDGRATLAGPVFDAEVPQLVAGVRRVRGVSGIVDELERHVEAGHIPALQGAGPLARRADGDWIRWTPTARVMLGAAGLGLLAMAARQRRLPQAAIGLAGLELLEKAVRGARPAA
jgi:hypothetical protein